MSTSEPTLHATPASPLLEAPACVEMDERQIGGKAAGLARLDALGMRVPQFFVVGVEHFREHMEGTEVSSALGRMLLAAADESVASGRQESVRDAAAWLMAAVQSQPLGARLREALGQLPADCRWAVRSSMVGEDSARHSFAGQLETFLHQEIAELSDAIRRCWASAYSERALTYGARVGIPPAEVRMAVVVQRMVDADVSGVLFTANPHTGRRDECVAVANWGLGQGVVDGSCDTDEYVWSADDGERSAVVADKDRCVRWSEATHATEETEVPDADRARRALSPAQLEEVCQEAQRIAEATGVPMDVEWSYGGGRLHLLQARPITSLSVPTDPAGPSRVFDNANIQESYCGVTTPLTFSFASRAYARVFQQFLEVLGASDRTLAAFEPAGRNMLSLVEGRVYYNLNSWFEMLRLFPGFERKKEDTEKNWHAEASTLDEERRLDLRERARAAYVRARIGLGVAIRFARVDKDTRRFVQRFEALYANYDRDGIQDLELSRLYDLGEQLQRELLEAWNTPNINDFRVMMACGRLRRLLERHHGDEAAARLADLLGGIPGLQSVQPTRLLMKIAADAGREPAVAAALSVGEAGEALEEVRARFPEFAARIDDYVKRYGDRCIGELKLETVSLRDDPGFVVTVLRNYLSGVGLDADSFDRADRERYEIAYAELRACLGPLGRSLLGRRVATARRAVAAREEMRLLRTLAFGLARDVFRAIGLRLHEAGALDHPRDVLYLTVDELTEFYEGRAVSADLMPIVVARKQEWAQYRQRDAPNRVEVKGSPYLRPLAQRDADPADVPRDGVLHGIGCCAGVVDADVRVILSADEDLAVNGQIICTVRTDPGWTPLFPTAAGLIVERGSSLSHSAVIARELGIPTVVGVRDATRIIRDGQRVRLDGARGTVAVDPATAH